MRNPFRLLILPAILFSVAAALAADDTPTTVPTTAPAAIGWDQAKDHIGQTVIVTGPVMGTHDFGQAAVLNVGKDFPSPDRFTVYISADARAEMPKDLDKGKTISVTGKLEMFHNLPEIKADATHITVADAPSATPTTQP